jgi:hypothetical protein
MTDLDRKKTEKENEALGLPAGAVDGVSEDVARGVLILARDKEGDDNGEDCAEVAEDEALRNLGEELGSSGLVMPKRGVSGARV